MIKKAGTKDYLFLDALKFLYVTKKLEKVFRSFNFYPVIFPAYESRELLTKKSGIEIEQSLFYLFTPKSINMYKKGERDLKKLLQYALRFDGTVPVVRIILEKGKNFKLPIKFYYICPVWRYEEVKSKRYREFWQAGVELIGVKEVDADLQIILLLTRVFEEFKINNYIIKLGDRIISEEILKNLGVKKKNTINVLRIIDKINKMNKKEIKKMLKEIGESENVVEEYLKYNSLEKVEEIIKSKEGKEELKKLKELFDLLDKLKIKNVKFDLTIVRGLDYYSSIVFEAFVNGKLAVAGGGRYDNLFSIYDKKVNLPATGFGIGIERFMDLVKVDKRELENNKIFIYYTSKELKDEAIRISNILRDLGYNVDFEIKRRSMKKSLSYASAMNYEYFIIIGDEEYKEGKVIIKDLDYHWEVEVSIDEITKFFQNKLE